MLTFLLLAGRQAVWAGAVVVLSFDILALQMKKKQNIISGVKLRVLQVPETLSVEVYTCSCLSSFWREDFGILCVIIQGAAGGVPRRPQLKKKKSIRRHLSYQRKVPNFISHLVCAHRTNSHALPNEEFVPQ